MKLENLIDALDAMINVGTDTKFIISDCFDNTILWQGLVAEFDRKSWLSRSIESWRFIEESNTVRVYVWNGGVKE